MLVGLGVLSVAMAELCDGTDQFWQVMRSICSPLLTDRLTVRRISVTEGLVIVMLTSLVSAISGVAFWGNSVSLWSRVSTDRVCVIHSFGLAVMVV